jgi:hypothetical protein
MIKKIRFPLAPLLWLLFVPTLLTASCQENTQAASSYSLDEVRIVFAAIDKITAETQQPWEGPPRSITITEGEFNSYTAYRIETEKEEIMKELRLKLFDNNKIEGKVHIDLRGQDIPRFIKPEMDVFFSANLLVDNGKARFDMQKLFLGDEPIKPFIIDLVIGISARLNHQEATSINDWYELPYGIKDIKTENGKATFYY